jgi:hypothetical protein
MNQVTAILSMLHEGPEHNSATRRFRDRPVLQWTLNRLQRSEYIDRRIILCWDDHLLDVCAIAADYGGEVLKLGERQPIAHLDAIESARKWADGWRGGLLSTCDFDRGYHAPWIKHAAEQCGAAEIVLVSPSAALVDPMLLDDLIDHAQANPDVELCFSQAAPGLSGVLLRKKLIDRLAELNTHPGRILAYSPDQPVHDPIASAACAPVPTPVARTTYGFKLESQRQLRRISNAFESLNGQLIGSDAETLVQRMAASARAMPDEWPREIVLELTTRRASRAIFRAGTHLPIERPDFTVEAARMLFEELAACDDLRLTLAGVGDPMLSADVIRIIELAKASGVHAVHVETDFLEVDPALTAALAAAEVDAVSAVIPAMSGKTYEAVMGVAGLAPSIENLKLFLNERARRGRSTPLLVPTFVKCRQNLAEMETWYDQWLRAAGSAVILGPSDFGGQIPSCAVADMAPPRRTACNRLSSRLTILSDGSIVTCEEDVLGRQPLGRVGQTSIAEAWRTHMQAIRRQHACGEWSRNPVCAACREWHRP